MELRQRLIGKTDVVEGAVDNKCGHVFGQIECVGHVGGVEDKVKGKGPGLGPLFVLGANELFGAEGKGVVAFGGCMRDRVGFRAECR